MSAPEIEVRHPLQWPEGRLKTGSRSPALFRRGGARLTIADARQRLREQVNAMTAVGQDWRVLEQVLTFNVRLTPKGEHSRSQVGPDDPGAAFYFELDDRPHALACDRWDTVADNIAAIAAHIEALRGQERWGVGDLRQAFAGHAALPPPAPWWDILGITRDSSIDDATRAWRTAAKRHHPDAGGNRAEWDKINEAYEAAKRELA